MRLPYPHRLSPLLLAALLAGPAAASPSFLGPTGYLLTPSADTLGSSHYAMALRHRARTNLISAAYSPLKSMEFGVAIIDPTAPGDQQTEAALNAKMIVVRESAWAPTLSVGMWDLMNWVEESSYAVASKSIRLPWPRRKVRLSAGVGSGVFERGFWGLSVPVSGSVMGLLELDGKNFNVGARLEMPAGFSLDVSMVQSELGLGAAYGASW